MAVRYYALPSAVCVHPVYKPRLASLWGHQTVLAASLRRSYPLTIECGADSGKPRSLHSNAPLGLLRAHSRLSRTAPAQEELMLLSQQHYLVHVS